MDAAEIIEWLGYYQLQDDKNKERLETEIAHEKSEEEKDLSMFNFFNKFTKIKNPEK